MINKVVNRAEKLYPRKKRFYEFIRIFFEKSSLDYDSHLTIENWVEISYFHWLVFSKTNDNKINYNFEKPSFSNKNEFHLSLVMPDMPFIVDSVRNMFVRNNMQILDIINIGQLYVDRNDKGELKTFGYELSKGAAEAVLYIRMHSHLNVDSKALMEQLELVVEDIQLSVEDWRSMQSCVSRSIDDYRKLNLSRYENQTEIVDFLIWFKEFFTFIGYREYRYNPVGKLVVKRNSELGVLKHKNKSRGYNPSTATIPAEELISISKSSAISSIHRSVQTDLISIRVFDDKGKPKGEKRFIGLFTSDAFDSDPTKIPLLRQKAQNIILKSNLTSSRFAEKKLLHILKTLPREELFQATTQELYRLVLGVFFLHEKFTYRVFIRSDYHLRFISAFVYMPRHNFNTYVFKKINGLFEHEFQGKIVSSTPFFSESSLVRIHISLKTSQTADKFKSEEEMSEMVKFLAESWQDRFKRVLIEQKVNCEEEDILLTYVEAFGPGYKANYSPSEALEDIAKFGCLNYDHPIEFSFRDTDSHHGQKYQLKIFQLNLQKVTLSSIIPIIENLGFFVINERSFKIGLSENHEIFLNDILLTPKYESDNDIDHLSDLLLPYLHRLCSGMMENDLLNSFVMRSSFGWRDALMLRVYCKYMGQLNFNLSQPYIHNCLLEQHTITSKIVNLFYLRFCPDTSKQTEEVDKLIKSITSDIDKVKLLDHDRVLRTMLGMIEATVRTNFFFEGVNDIVIKLKSAMIPNIPLPAPLFESFVYSTEFEGVHLRGGMVARGGLRWSDRKEDFRTEVLGLMTAQQVKNAIIVPAGAKGGFVVKSTFEQYDEWLKNGIECYRSFIFALLSITDNIINNRLSKPKRLVCYDDNDPYLVVAADKGTAKFSDIANSISQECSFWLDDAFASGGRFGYDHKVLGITAKGAWESVIWHFRNLEIDLDKPFTVMGVGDMSGDVFGNGMLLSNQIALVAAFNHEAIFIDPNPDVKATFAERKRLFKLPRSKWSDFNKSLLSKGGAIYQRSDKSIELSAEAMKALGTTQSSFTPNDLINTILKAPVDLFWNGGIGTYVKASTESHLDAKDKQNDSLRINGNELRCKVVAEGGNLGFTQRARVEYACNGGAINTDFIDNSGGVDCSDIEVNSKILLNMLVKKGSLTFEKRNKILEDITDEVCEAVLKDNRQQNEVISFAQYQGIRSMVLFLDYLKWAESNGIINRDLEGFTDDASILQRKFFTRPELAVMFAKTILLIKEKLADSDVIKLKLVHEFLELGIAPTLVKKYSNEIKNHYLKKEIIITQLAKHFVFEMGVTFYHQISRETQRSFDDIITAFVIARYVTNYSAVYNMVAEIGYKVSTKTLIALFDMYRRLLRRLVRLLLSENYNLKSTIKSIDSIKNDAKQTFLACRKYNKKHLPKQSMIYDISLDDLKDTGLKKLLDGRFYWHILTIMKGVKETKSKLEPYAETFFALRFALDFNYVIKLIDSCDINDYVDNLTKITLKQSLERNFASIVNSLLCHKLSIEDWSLQFQDELKNWNALIIEADGAQKNRLSLFVVLNRIMPNFIVQDHDS